MVKFKKTVSKLIKFNIWMYKKSKLNQLENILNKKLYFFVTGIYRILKDEENIIETNQRVLSVNYLFRGIIIKAWIEINSTITKYSNQNCIINKHCIDFYVLY